MLGDRLRCVISVLVLVVPLVASAHAAENTLSPAEVAEGWILLFDGQTLFGWQPASQVDWKVAEGAITATQGEQGLLATTSQFGDYVLKVDFRAAAGANSGIFLRTPPSWPPRTTWPTSATS